MQNPRGKPLDFLDVLLILGNYGDKILSAISLLTYNAFDEKNKPRIYYSCYEGIDFLGSLFNLKREFRLRDNLEHLDEYRKEYEEDLKREADEEPTPEEPEEASLPESVTELIERYGIPNLNMRPGYMYFCQLDTSVIGGDYSTDQVHYFLFLYDENPLLLQAFGGIPGFTLKAVRSNINGLIKKILGFNHEVYRKLFEVQEKHEYLLHFDKASFRAVEMPLYYPNLSKLNYFLQLLNLDFATEKLQYRI